VSEETLSRSFYVPGGGVFQNMFIDPLPEFELGVLIKDIPKRYTVVVVRTATSDAAKGNEGGSAKSDTIATVVFEGHPRSFLSFSAGIAAVFRPDMQGFNFKSRVLQDSSVVYSVDQDGAPDFEPKFIASLGFYLFGPIDDFDPKEWCRLRATIGVQIALKPEMFFVGLDYEFPWGGTIGGGLTWYKKVVLLDPAMKGRDYSEQTVSKLGRTVPTKTEAATGFFLAVQFRPSIFDAFFKIFKREI